MDQLDEELFTMAEEEARSMVETLGWSQKTVDDTTFVYAFGMAHGMVLILLGGSTAMEKWRKAELLRTLGSDTLEKVAKKEGVPFQLMKDWECLKPLVLVEDPALYLN